MIKITDKVIQKFNKSYLNKHAIHAYIFATRVHFLAFKHLTSVLLYFLSVIQYTSINVATILLFNVTTLY